MNARKIFRISIVLIVLISIGLVLFLKPSKKAYIPPPSAPANQAYNKHKAHVVQVSEVITDSLSVHLRPEKSVLPSGPFVLLEEKSKNITIPPLTKQAKEKGQNDPSLYIDANINAIEDIGAIVIEKIKFSGQGRYGDFQKVYLSQSLPLLFISGLPSDISIKVNESLLDLFDVIPGPDNFEWNLTEQSKLLIDTGGRTYNLSPGEEIILPAHKVEIPVTVETLAPVPKGDIPPDEFGQTETIKFGATSFKTVISIKYYGKFEVGE